MKRIHYSTVSVSVAFAAVLTVSFFALGAGTTPTPPPAPADTVNHAQCSKPDFSTLRYEFGWNGVAAANATIRIRQETYNNSPAIRISGDAHTIGVARSAWKMDDSIEAIVNPQTLKPLRVEIAREEGGRSYRTNISFFHTTLTARVTHVKGTKVKQKTIKYGQSYDPLTLILVVRCLNFEVGRSVTFDVLDGNHIYRVVLYVIAKEILTLRSGKYTAYKVRPSFSQIPPDPKDQTNSKVNEVFIWVSADPQKYFLQVKSKIFIGSVYGELVRVEK